MVREHGSMAGSGAGAAAESATASLKFRERIVLMKVVSIAARLV
jgi:hypothetical protein